MTTCIERNSKKFVNRLTMGEYGYRLPEIPVVLQDNLIFRRIEREIAPATKESYHERTASIREVRYCGGRHPRPELSVAPGDGTREPQARLGRGRDRSRQNRS